ncbi:MAG: hypothetical protein AAGH57_04045 [Pseudomonadota bacterium]
MIARTGLMLTLGLILAGCDQRFNDEAVEGLAGIPVPASATQTVDRPKGEFFRIRASKDGVAEWYARQLPSGRDFRNWQWCVYRPGQFEGYTFYDPSIREVLDVTIIEEGGETGISINIAPLIPRDLERCS